MFGQQNDDNQYQQHDDNQIPDNVVNDNLPQPDQEFGQPQPAATDNDTTAVPPFNPSIGSSRVISPMPSDAPASDTPAPSNDDTSAPTPAAIEVPSDLLDIKQQALSQLSPLVGHLEQSPEERFRTTMMMIQATDNQDLVKDAYAAAQDITDEKAKAQALLDVVNEINYFTQHPSS